MQENRRGRPFHLKCHKGLKMRGHDRHQIHKRAIPKSVSQRHLLFAISLVAEELNYDKEHRFLTNIGFDNTGSAFHFAQTCCERQ
jgi:hypothetical protein